MTFDADGILPRTPGGSYRIQRELGRGGMATVYLCTDSKTDEHVAVKILRPELANVVARERFVREVTFASRLDHPRIPRVLESGTTGGHPYYAMEYVEGESLRDRLIREPQLPSHEAIRIVREAAKPISYAHERQILHRDIKPENILLRGDDVYVLDFGIARAIADAAGARLTRTGITLGTPAYMSPEQAIGERDLDVRSDVFSLGCVLYEMLAGKPAYSGATPQVLMASRLLETPRSLSAVRPDVPKQLAAAVTRALAVEPAARWDSIDDFVAALLVSTAEVADTSEKSLGDSGIIDKVRRTFAESYRVEDELKGGGMSRLFLATDLSLNRRVVIKILPPDLVSPMTLARFKRESEVTAQLQHPHILPVISAGVRDELVYYIMPFIDGESLRGRLERERQLPIHDCVRLLKEVTDALAYAHLRGIIHRDIKPENILIQDGHAVLADFGIAAALTGAGPESGQRLTGTGMSLGTVGYMAPEQALGERNVDARADVYAVGIVGYEMFAGAPPFSGATDQAVLVAHLTHEARPLSELRTDTPGSVADAIRTARQDLSASRFQTAVEFRDALDAAATPRVAASPTTRPARLTSFRSKLIAVPLLLLAVAIAAGLFIRNRNAALAGDQRVSIAIAPFNTLDGDLGLWREGMVDVLARNLDGIGPFLTVSPMVAIRGFEGSADRNSAIELARRTKAQYAIYGTIVGSSRDSVRLRASLVNVANARVWDFEGRDSTVESATGKFTIALLRELGKSHRIGAVRQSSFGSSSISALRAFLQGEQFYRRTSWDSASAAYARAVRFDKNFAIALRRSAQVMGWQKDGKDSLARALWVQAGKLNRGLAPRDSMLIVADSISAALAPVLLDSMNWRMVRRLFETVNAASRRYPDDPEVWYVVGEARFHFGWSSVLGVTERSVLDAFSRAIALDPAFGPSYVHAVELAFNLDGAASGKRIAEAYLRGKPTDKQAEAVSIVQRVAREEIRSGADMDSVLDEASGASIMAAYFTLRRWPDTAQTALRLLQSASRRPRTSPTFVEDSIRLWNYMPLQLAYHGRLSEASLLIGKRPSRMYVEMAMLGAVQPDTASAVMSRWIDEGLKPAFTTLPWLAQRNDTTNLKRLIARADSESRTGTELPRRSARYRASSAKAYLSLARADTADAIARFTALADTLCVACYVDRLETAKLLAARGRLAEAEKLLSLRVYNLITPMEVRIAFERARVAALLGHRDEALRSYRLVEAAWGTGDPGIQGYVADSRSAIRRLQGQAQAP